MVSKSWLQSVSLAGLFCSALAMGCSSSDSNNNADGGTAGAGSAGAGASGGSGGGGSGGGGAFTSIAPCTTAAKYVTGTAIATTEDPSYNPACLKVTVGATVTIEASDEHPLKGDTTGSANNPIAATEKTTNQTVTFASPGFYPFHCDVHKDLGMKGVVWVQ